MVSTYSQSKKINIFKNGNNDLTDKIESMTNGDEKLSERIHTAEFKN